MKKLLTVLLALVCLLAMTGCCFHEWAEADCVNPKTCLYCGETEGEALGHQWQDATCVAPKTCSVCGETEGEALGHQWQDATTEAPKTCSVCSETEGERIITDERFTTAACQDLFGDWSGTVTVNGEMMGLDGFAGTFDMLVTMSFANDGNLVMTSSVVDLDALKTAVADYTVEMLYTEFTASGITREEADEAMVAAYGMTTVEFVNAIIEEMNLEETYQDAVTPGVYYVQDGLLYLGDSWDDELEFSTFTLSGDTLTIDEALGDFTALTLKRVAE